MHAADGGRARPAGRGIVIRRVVLAFAAGVLFLAPRASAQTVLTPNPAVLRADQLNGAGVTLQAPAGGRFGFAAALDNRWSASGAPAGVTVTVVTAAEPKLTHGRTRANLVIRATGSSTRDWDLYIIGTNHAVDGNSGDVSFGPIRVQPPPPGVTLTPNPAVLRADQLNGAGVTLQAPAGGRFGSAAAFDNRWSASGTPAGVTVTVVTAPERS